LALSESDRDFARYVDPFIGTAGRGHTFPGAAYPLGLVQLSPDTGNGNWDYCAGYQHGDVTVDGFSHTHASGGGTGDFGDVLVLPFSGPAVLEAERATQDKSAERAAPGWYATRLVEDDIAVELAATERTGIHRYTFNGNGRRQLLVSIDRILWTYGERRRSFTHDAVLTVDGPRAVSGGYYSLGKARREVYFAIEFNRPVVSHRYLDEPHNKKLVLDFGEEGGGLLEVRTGISTVSPESARRNLEVESRDKSFAQIRDEAREAWNRHLGKVEIRAAPEKMTQFYTAMYHLHLQPNNIADVDGRYRGADEGIYESASRRQYTMLAFWDVYRAAWPLNTLLDPALHAEYLRAALDHYDQAGFLPVWGIWGKSSQTMIGNHAVTVLWDAINKGVPGIDEEKAYRAVKDSLTKQHGRKSDWTNYDPYGYFPSDVGYAESVSRTLETALNDWCAAQFAKRLGRDEDYAFFSRRARFYRNLFNPQNGFFQGRLADGSWREPFDPLEIFHSGSSSGDYTEANAWQYLWSVQHDIPDLVSLLGGPDSLGRKLDALFALPPVIYGKGTTVDVSGMIGQYAHGNEPSHHVAYLYNYANRPHRTQELLRQIMETMYQPHPDGLSGNDDFGQMSGWYILSSLGLYPVHPASGVYDFGVPDQEFAQVRLGDSGKTLTVRAVPFDPAKPYVRQVSFNGRPIPSLQIAHAEIMAGGELVFEMSDRPAPIAPSETGVRSAGGGAIPGTVVNPGNGLAP
jgi:predicted alpha-1,2-mannosidase